MGPRPLTGPLYFGPSEGPYQWVKQALEALDLNFWPSLEMFRGPHEKQKYIFQHALDLKCRP